MEPERKPLPKPRRKAIDIVSPVEVAPPFSSEAAPVPPTPAPVQPQPLQPLTETSGTGGGYAVPVGFGPASREPAYALLLAAVLARPGAYEEWRRLQRTKESMILAYAAWRSSILTRKDHA